MVLFNYWKVGLTKYTTQVTEVFVGDTFRMMSICPIHYEISHLLLASRCFPLCPPGLGKWPCAILWLLPTPQHWQVK